MEESELKGPTGLIGWVASRVNTSLLLDAASDVELSFEEDQLSPAILSFDWRQQCIRRWSLEDTVSVLDLRELVERSWFMVGRERVSGEILLLLLSGSLRVQRMAGVSGDHCAAGYTNRRLSHACSGWTRSMLTEALLHFLSHLQ